MVGGNRGRRQRRLIVAAVPLIALGIAVGAVLPGPQPAFSPVSITPAAGALAPRCAFAATLDRRINSIALSPDGTTLYANLEIGAINLWSCLAWCFPEALALALGTLATLVLWRLLSPRPDPAGAHCRRCNYLLALCTSDRCPECGLELTPANRGPSRRRRWLTASMAAVAGVLVAVTSLRMGPVPRDAWSDRFNWPSPILYDWAMHGGSWLQSLASKHQGWVFRVVEIDASSGRIRRATTGHSSLALSEDGSLLAFTHGSTLCLWDARAGKLRHRLRAVDDLGIPDVFAFAVSDDGRHAWAADAGPTVVVIDAISGRVVHRAAIDDLIGPRASAGPRQVRQMAHLSGQNRLAMVIIEGDWHWHPQHSIMVVVEPDLSGRAGEPVVVPGYLMMAAFAPAGSRWCARGVGGAGPRTARDDLLIFDGIDKGNPDTVSLRRVGASVLGTSADGDGRLLAASWDDGHAVIGITGGYGTEPWAPMAMLSGNSVGWTSFAFAADARTLIAGGVRAGTTGKEAIFAVYDLEQLPEPPLSQEAPGGD